MKKLLREFIEEDESSFVPNSLKRILPKFTMPDDPLPVKPVVPSWQISDGKRLFRTFEFDNSKHIRVFLLEVMNLQDRTLHYGTFVIHKNVITIETQTQGIDDVTEIDFDYAKAVDEIYEDSKFWYHDT